MKKIIIWLSVLLPCMLQGQNWVDALRYSQTYQGSTARSLGMGGAFGALGGDFSSLSINPAGAAVYRKSEVTFSPEIRVNTVSSGYFENTEQDQRYNFNFNNISYLGAYYNKDEKSGLKGVTFGVGYNRIANFHNKSLLSGVNPHSSFAEKMANNANKDSEFDSYYEDLYYRAYLIHLYDDNTYKVEDSDLPLPIGQSETINSKGYINDWVFALGLNFTDKIYVGASIDVYPLYFEQNKTYREYDPVSTDTYFTQREYFEVQGSGWGAKLGIIARPLPYLRLGISLHTPIYYRLEDRYQKSILSYFDNEGYKGSPTTYYPMEYDIDGYPLGQIDISTIDINIKTPGRITGSAAYIIGKKGIVSADVELVDYGKMKLESVGTNGLYHPENMEIKKNFGLAVNARIGGELRLGNTYYRGGIAYSDSPYEATQNFGYDQIFNYRFSAGIGYRDKSYFVDLAASYQAIQTNGITYSFERNANDIELYTVESNRGIFRLTTTIGFRF